ncbi:MAG TPA: LAGLIDADG family homing endonuclease [Candidatus Omnitrophota bacterium]|nr:LAGLIDADG family homing endonuclease [Candidatus Omnitrophota bacterium]
MKLNSLTVEVLNDLYVNRKKSLQDIADMYNVSRVAIYKKLKQFGIRQRTKSEARLEAQKQQKLPQQFFDINERFFDDWSSDMAYVLGLLFTDGCLSKTGAVALSINDKDLLEAVRNAMRSTHKIEQSNHQKSLYIFHFARESMVERLKALGLVSHKSMVIKFPEVPFEYLSDFLRGVFDGDGSVFFDKRNPRVQLVSTFVSGSQCFMADLENNLNKLGLPRRKIYKHKTKNGYSYTIAYGHKDSISLFGILYGNIGNGIFLKRKYKRFLEGINRS